MTERTRLRAFLAFVFNSEFCSALECYICSELGSSPSSGEDCPKQGEHLPKPWSLITNNYQTVRSDLAYCAVGYDDTNGRVYYQVNNLNTENDSLLKSLGKRLDFLRNNARAEDCLKRT